ncbi:DUF1616 domain-containing protein [Acidianus sp. RZ1]|uniref:DUF1616 domain-containing protein n=1 Tax=Acidianus sp. RZ1 TaxID=1540082 RepID=UPI001492598C|nr:DUF1616 domain-containing protein [Acidianus sp. RZ1]NON63041.1 DUF1616 domain-containing protein [Acidianus sp. RZ1]
MSLQQLISQYHEVYSNYMAGDLLIHYEMYFFLILPIIVFITLYFYKAKIEEIYLKLWYFVNKKSKLRSIKVARNSIFAGILVGLVIITSIFALGYSVVFSKENFSYIALLDSHKTIGNYQTCLQVNQMGQAYVVVKNHEGYPVLYEVKVFLVGNNENTSLSSFYSIVDNGKTWEFPFSYSVNSTGTYRIQFFLYMFNSKENNFTYSGEFVQLYLNVSE